MEAGPGVLEGGRMQTMDYTTLMLLGREINASTVPARLENIMQTDDFTVRTAGRRWWCTTGPPIYQLSP
jgi:hypothetical protein